MDKKKLLLVIMMVIRDLVSSVPVHISSGQAKTPKSCPA